MTETWTEVLQVKPRPGVWRARCTVDGCTLAAFPARFATLDTAEAWARDHADHSALLSHVVAVEALTVTEP